MAISHMAQDLADLDLSGDIARQCMAVQQELFSFTAAQTGALVPPTQDKFFRATECAFGEFTVRLNLYNTAWLSRKKERQGELLFPVSAVEPLLARLPHVDLTISLLHHPYNWFAANNARELRKADRIHLRHCTHGPRTRVV